MPEQKRRLLPREGFTADVLVTVLRNSIFNPSLTLPAYIFSRFASTGIEWASRNPKALKGLRTALLLGLITQTSSYLSRKSANNWKSDVYDWKKEIVVVTGGSDGIGAIVVKELAKRGIVVAVLDIQELTYPAPEHVHFFRCDLTSASDIANVGSAIKTTVGDPTVLINNAGIARNKDILHTTPTDLRLNFGVNTFSHYALAHAFLPAMIAQNHGMVVTVASLAAHVTAPGMVDYAASKAASMAFHEGLSSELATLYKAPRVRTLLVCQGYTRTSLFQGFHEGDPFLAYPLAPETVAEAIVEKVLRGEGGQVLLPRVVGKISSMIRGQPLWHQNRVRNNDKFMQKFRGRMVTQPSEGNEEGAVSESWVKESGNE